MQLNTSPFGGPLLLYRNQFCADNLTALDALIKVVSIFLCEFFEEGQIRTHLPYWVCSPMQLHSQRDKGEESVAAQFTRHDLHGPCSSFELLIQSLDNVGGAERYPLFLGKMEKGQAGLQRSLQTCHC